MALNPTELAAVMKQIADETKAGGGAYDPLAELGITLEEKQYASRFEALTDPSEYAKKRVIAFTGMKVAVTASYDNALKEFVKAGYPSDQAKGSALAAAEQTRRVQRLIIEQQFPSSANAIGDAMAVKNAGGLKGSLGGTAPRQSAPRKSTRSAADRAESARKGAATRAKNAKAKAKAKK